MHRDKENKIRNTATQLSFRCKSDSNCEYYKNIRGWQGEPWVCVCAIPHTCKKFDKQEDLVDHLRSFGRGVNQSNYETAYLNLLVQDLIKANMSAKAGNTTNKRKFVDVPGTFISNKLS